MFMQKIQMKRQLEGRQIWYCESDCDSCDKIFRSRNYLKKHIKYESSFGGFLSNSWFLTYNNERYLDRQLAIQIIIIETNQGGEMTGIKFHSIAVITISNVKNVEKDLWFKANYENVSEEGISMIIIFSAMCNVGIGIFIPKKIMKFECTETMSISWNNEAVLFVQNNSMLKFGLKIRDY